VDILVLFIASLFAEFIANDKPYYISFEGKSYFPVVVSYPETHSAATSRPPPTTRPVLAEAHQRQGRLHLWRRSGSPTTP